MRTGLAALLMLALTATLAQAQPAGSPQHKGHPVVWTVVGAGGGFALGLLAGLNVFDDDVESEQKVWATAAAAAFAGGMAAYLLSRQRTRARTAAPARLTEAEIRALAAQVRLGAPQAAASVIVPPAAQFDPLTGLGCE